MKKILIILTLLLSICLIWSVSASETAIQVTVSEDLSPLLGDGKCRATTWSIPEWWGPPEATWYYECDVEKWFGSVQTLLGNSIKYATFLIGLVGVLFIVINGIMYSIGGEDKSQAKDRIMKSVMWLILLLLSWVLLNAIAPWIYTTT